MENVGIDICPDYWEYILNHPSELIHSEYWEIPFLKYI